MEGHLFMMPGIINGHLVVVEKLVSEYGCDLNARDSGGLTPLHVAEGSEPGPLLKGNMPCVFPLAGLGGRLLWVE